MVVELDKKEGIKAHIVYPGGQSGNPGSANYSDFVDTWAAGEYYEALFMKSSEEKSDRIDMLITLANLPEAPDSVPINMLMPQADTPLANAEPIEPFDFVRVIALARIMMPTSHVRLSAGRTDMSDEMQAMCFFAGANSVFVGDTLLTAENPESSEDMALFNKLGILPMEAECNAKVEAAE